MTYLSRQENLSYSDQFIMRQQIRVILKLLGTRYAHKVMIAKAGMVLEDRWPFKVRRLRMLIDG